MRSLFRWLPLLVLAGGSMWMAPKARVVFRKTVTAVKAYFVGTELGSIADRVVSDGGSFGCDLEDPDQFADFIHDFFAGQTASRDTAVDMWGYPYLLECTGYGEFVVFSLGPNGEADECALSDGDWGLSSSKDQVPQFQALPGQTDQDYEGDEPGAQPDDVCAHREWPE